MKKKMASLQFVPPFTENVNVAELQTICGRIKERKKIDRFNGMTEEEVVKRTLPDHLSTNLDIVIIGVNPGLFAAYKGHHYAGPGNHFWKCLYLSGLTLEQMSAEEDYKLMKYGIGFTNIVQRPTKGCADLTRKEIKDGTKVLLQKLQRFRPKIAVFNGRLIFEIFSGTKDFNFGRQPEYLEGTETFMWVMPSSSARCAQLPRAADKVPFYTALKKFRDYLKGLVTHIEESEYIFTKESIKQNYEQELFENIGAPQIFQQRQSTSNANIDVVVSANQNSDSQVFNSTTTFDSLGGISNRADLSVYLNAKIPEKKKRGRPKKIREHPVVNSIGTHETHLCNQIRKEDVEYNINCSNVNISMISPSSSHNNKTLKKKRGRPKKIKENFSKTNNEVSANYVKSNTLDMNISFSRYLEECRYLPHSYTNPQRNKIFDKSSEAYSTSASPADSSTGLNYSYTSTPSPIKISNTLTQDNAIGVLSDHMELQNQSPEKNGSNSPPTLFNHAHQFVQIDTPLQESTQIHSSPKNAAGAYVEFDDGTPTRTLQIPSASQLCCTEFGPVQQSSSIYKDVDNNDPFKQWKSSQNSRYSARYALQHLQQYQKFSSQSTLQYVPDSLHCEHHKQHIQNLQIQNHQSPLHSQYLDIPSRPHIMSVRQFHKDAIKHQGTEQMTIQSNSGDLTRKSLCGLESLVDLIPTISPNQTEEISMNTANFEEQKSFFVDPIQNNSFVNNETNNTTNNTFNANYSSNSSIQRKYSNSDISNTSLVVSSSTEPNTIKFTKFQDSSNVYHTHRSNTLSPSLLACPVTSSVNHHNHRIDIPSRSYIYKDPHAHITSHIPLNSLYSATYDDRPITYHHGDSCHHTDSSDYNLIYRNRIGVRDDYSSNSYATQSNGAHMFHMPSPNYPYGVATTCTQRNYMPYTHPHHDTGHSRTHLYMFNCRKASDIKG